MLPQPEHPPNKVKPGCSCGDSRLHCCLLRILCNYMDKRKVVTLPKDVTLK